MEVLFHRINERQYGISVQRPGEPETEIVQGPGFHALVPHDLMHLLVESELGLERAIFGQLAAGGNMLSKQMGPRTKLSRREASRTRRRLSRKGEKLMREGRDESAQSERATYLCLYAWLTRSPSARLRGKALEMRAVVQNMRAGCPPQELRALTEDVVDRVCRRLDDLSAQWGALEDGESIAVPWSIRPRAQTPRGRRAVHP